MISMLVHVEIDVVDTLNPLINTQGFGRMKLDEVLRFPDSTPDRRVTPQHEFHQVVMEPSHQTVLMSFSLYLSESLSLSFCFSHRSG